MPAHERREPATSRYDMRYDDPRMNPIAFLPAQPWQITYGDVMDHVPVPPERVAAEDLTYDDHLVEPTDNSLRPADLGLSQPPQAPDWTPDDDG